MGERRKQDGFFERCRMLLRLCRKAGSAEVSVLSFVGLVGWSVNGLRAAWKSIRGLCSEPQFLYNTYRRRFPLRCAMNKDQLALMIQDALPKARRVASRILYPHVNDVEDVLQEASLKAWLKYDQFQGKCLFSTWFTAIVVRTSLMQMRKYKTKLDAVRAHLTTEFAGEVHEVDLDYLPANHYRSPEEVAIFAQTKQRIAEGILQLKPTLREEICKAVLGEQVVDNNHKSRRFRARRQLEEILAA